MEMTIQLLDTERGLEGNSTMLMIIYLLMGLILVLAVACYLSRLLYNRDSKEEKMVGHVKVGPKPNRSMLVLRDKMKLEMTKELQDKPRRKPPSISVLRSRRSFSSKRNITIKTQRKDRESERSDKLNLTNAFVPVSFYLNFCRCQPGERR